MKEAKRPSMACFSYVETKRRYLRPGTTLGAVLAVFLAVAAPATADLEPANRFDPASCNPMTDAELQNVGYEPVRFHGATGDGLTDDTAAIQAAIDSANQLRRVVYLHPGTYLVSDTLEFKQDVYLTRSNDGTARFGEMLLGSYCGDTKPTVRLKDGVATETDEQTIAAEPFPVVLLWRPNSENSSGPDDTNGGRHWNEIVRNVQIVVGGNPGAVGIRHGGAEGSALQEVSIDASGGFAGVYNLPGSGGYTYNLEVVGGRYGIYLESNRGGATLVVGLRLVGQENTPLAINSYTPFGVVGFDISHDDGEVVSAIDGPEEAHVVTGKLETQFHDSGGHLFLVDGKIETTGETPAVISNTDRAVYLRNVYFKGATTLLASEASGRLLAEDGSTWSRVREYAYSGPYESLYDEAGNLIRGNKHDDTYFNGLTVAATEDVVVSESGSPPARTLRRHLYPSALCNVEAANSISVADFGADPNDEDDDTASIQAAIDAAAGSGNRVFLPASQADPETGELVGTYRVAGTLSLGSDTRLCGVTRYSSVLSAVDWKPSVDSPVLETLDSADATTTIADFKILSTPPGGTMADGYNPYVSSIHWRAGRRSLYRDVFTQRTYGDPGEARKIQVTGNGGGRWYGITLQGSYPPPDIDPDPEVEVRPFEDADGNLVMSPEARQLLVDGTHEPLRFYPFHCQHMTQPGAPVWEIVGASNVTVFGVKSEMASTHTRMIAIIESNPPELTPTWLAVRDSTNVSIIGHEGTSQTHEGRSLIEITDSSDVTIAVMGRRSNGAHPTNAAIDQSLWHFVEEARDGDSVTVTAEGVLTLFKSHASLSSAQRDGWRKSVSRTQSVDISAHDPSRIHLPTPIRRGSIDRPSRDRPGMSPAGSRLRSRIPDRRR